MYLEFVSAVTEDILSRGHISDRSVIFFLLLSYYCFLLVKDESLLCLYLLQRVLDRVIQRHVNMNRHQLDEVSLQNC